MSAFTVQKSNTLQQRFLMAQEEQNDRTVSPSLQVPKLRQLCKIHNLTSSLGNICVYVFQRRQKQVSLHTSHFEINKLTEKLFPLHSLRFTAPSSKVQATSHNSSPKNEGAELGAEIEHILNYI